MYFHITTDYSNYYAMIQPYYDGKHHYMDKVFLGSKKKCMVMSIYLDSDEPNIDSFGHNSNYDLAKKQGSIHMLKTGVSFIRKFYKDYFKLHKIKYIQLKDKADIDCMRDTLQNLATFYIVKHKKTWYEKNFECIPAIIPIEKYSKDCNALFTSMNTKPDINFGQKNKKLTELYTRYATFKDFFTYLAANFDCRIYKDWLDEYVSDYIPYLYGMKWKMPFNKANKIKITLKKLDERPKDLFIMKRN